MWPDLSTVKYVSARPATEDDINNGAAVFLLQSEGVQIGTPIDIVIPQYAIHTDGESGEKNKVIIIQAEEASGQEVYGAVLIETDEFMAGLANEFVLLGQPKPE